MKIKLYPDDAHTLGEKILWVAFHIVPLALFLFMQLSALQAFKNIYQKNVADAPVAWHIVGFVLSVGTIAWWYGIATESNRVTKREILNILVGVLAAIVSLLAYAGFVFNG